jgi:glycosyltransferase involved in cell wall biosynthesis
VRSVHQFVPTLHRGDAVGRHTLCLREVLVARGIDSRIFVETPDPETVEESQHYSSYPDLSQPGDVLLYQLATASGIASWLAARDETLVVNYHNITPPEHYAPWDYGMTLHQQRALAELELLAPRAALAVTDSSFDEAELHEAGYGRTAVVPPAAALPTLIDPKAPERREPSARRPEKTTGARWLSVGRIAPNKAIHHTIAGLLVARRHHDSRATLQIVGRPVVPVYARALRRYADELGLHDAVTFHGAVEDAEVCELFDRADVLVLTSEHEGFGVPAVEALAAGVPVVANREGALPEVVGDAGVLVDARDPYALAEGVAAALESRRDAESRAAGLEAARRRLSELDLATAAERTVDLVIALVP